jgi:predicted nucleotidyltransferase
MNVNEEMLRFAMDNAKALCEEHGVNFLFVSTGGSRAYGYNEKDSDQDVTFVFYRNPLDYFTISELPTTIKHPTLDVKGYDISKYLGIMAKSGWNVMEMLYTIPGTSGNQHENIIQDLRLLASKCFCPEKAAHAMAGGATTCFERFDKAQDTRERVKQLLSAARLIFSAINALDRRLYPSVRFRCLLQEMEESLPNFYPTIVNPCCFTSVFYILMSARRDGAYEYVERVMPLSEMEIIISILKDLQTEIFRVSAKYDCNLKESRELCDKFLQNFIKKEYIKTL